MHYYVDAYNLLFKVSKTKKTLEKDRQIFLQILNEKMAQLKWSVTLVFDGAEGVRGEVSRHHFKDLEIIYTSKGLSADDYILQEVTASTRPHDETVVTSDRELAGRCRQLGAHTLTIRNFLDVLSSKEQKSRQKGSEKSFRDSDAHFARLLKIFEEKLKEL